jgi:hypothetical protein
MILLICCGILFYGCGDGRRAVQEAGSGNPAGPSRPTVSGGTSVVGAGDPESSQEPSGTEVSSSPPAKGGYFQLVLPGHLSSLPTDGQAAAMVHRSSWEPRPDNQEANHTVPPASFKTAGYSGMLNASSVFGRVNGNFTGTTDEIIQWAAAKWGLPDELIRAEAVQETFWFQDLKDGQGRPEVGRGYGDIGACGGSPAPSGYGVNGPASFGLLQDKWCSFKDPDAPGYDGWPWSEKSTAYSVDLYAAVLRGCYEGWDTWLGAGYHAGDIWGCVGRWFSGAWYSALANDYINLVKAQYASKVWLSW